MKYLIFFTMLITIVIGSVSCKKDEVIYDPNAPLPTIYLSHEARSFIPADWRKAEYVVYKNNAGEIKKLKRHFIEEFNDFRLMDREYRRQQQSIILIDESDANYNITINVNTQYINTSETKEYVFIGLMTTLTNGQIPFIDFSTDQANTSYLKSATVSLNDRTFTEVYQDPGLFQPGQFSKIYYTKAEGVVGFKAYNNTLWVLDHLE